MTKPAWIIVGALTSLLVASWIVLAPVWGLPVGIISTDGPSMGDDHRMVSIWVDAEPDVGDIIIYDHGYEYATNDLFIHRIIDETDQGYLTKGDANPVPDQHMADLEYATERNTVGVVIIRLPLWKATLTFISFIVGVAAAINRLTRKMGRYGRNYVDDLDYETS